MMFMTAWHAAAAPVHVQAARGLPRVQQQQPRPPPRCWGGAAQARAAAAPPDAQPGRVKSGR